MPAAAHGAVQRSELHPASRPQRHQDRLGHDADVLVLHIRHPGRLVAWATTRSVLWLDVRRAV